MVFILYLHLFSFKYLGSLQHLLQTSGVIHYGRIIMTVDRPQLGAVRDFAYKVLWIFCGGMWPSPVSIQNANILMSFT